MDKQEVLQKIFGYSQFRLGQERLIDGVLSGQDVLGIMPTGGGKSICYQVPALLLPGITMVISPLISLMRDQVMALCAAGVAAAYINSSLSGVQVQAVYRNLHHGKYKIIYIAPERLDSSGFQMLAAELPIDFIAVDEAHCISQWGQDFRPSYLRIVEFIKGLPHRPVVGAFTATATAQVREDIERILGLRHPVKIITGFDRPNLFFDVRRPKWKDQELLALLSKRVGKSGIVYCSTRKKVEKVCALLCDNGFPATRYHAGLDEQERTENQEDFLYDRKTVMVATNAFGMGIDKSNVSFVIHYNMPQSLEAYYQEAGRAGRDGSESECVLLFNRGDVDTAQYFIDNDTEKEYMCDEQRKIVKQQDQARLEAMVGYCGTKDCLRGVILSYFGQEHSPKCGKCGTCLREYELVDITKEAQMILSCVKRVRDRLGYPVNEAMIARILRGSHNMKLTQLGLTELSTFGLMEGVSQKDIRVMLQGLTDGGYLEEGKNYSAVTLTPKAAEVLYRRKSVSILMEKRPKNSAIIADTEEAEEDAALFDLLREVRWELAKKAHVPAYVVFSDATLREMAQKQPTNMTAFKRISGVGELKASWYGRDFIARIREYQKKNG